jgi:hypothetical protein
LLGVEGLLAALVVVLVLFLVVGLVLFLVDLALAGVVLVLADVPAGDAALGAWAAKVKGMVATAKAIAAKNVVFIFSLPAGPSPAYNLILRQLAIGIDSLRRLSQAPKSGLPGLTFISLRN